MQESSIQIGPINFQDFEVPASIRFGGDHRLVVHHLSSGKRVVEALGPDDGSIVFHGTFSGSNAEARVQMMDGLRLSGKAVWLTWHSFRRMVIVKNLTIDFHNPWWISYQADCTVVNQAIVSPALTPSLSVVVTADLGMAQSAAVGSQIQLTTLQSALSDPSAFNTNSTGQALAVATVGSLLSTIDQSINLHSGLMTAYAGPSIGPASQGNGFDKIVTFAGSLAAAVNTRAYVGRIETNLNDGEL